MEATATTNRDTLLRAALEAGKSNEQAAEIAQMLLRQRQLRLVDEKSPRSYAAKRRRGQR